MLVNMGDIEASRSERKDAVAPMVTKHSRWRGFSDGFGPVLGDMVGSFRRC